MHPSKLRPVLAIRLFADDTKAFGPGVATLLHHVDALHSLRAAAAAMGMAYSKAWRITKESETAAAHALPQKHAHSSPAMTLTPRRCALLAMRFFARISRRKADCSSMLPAWRPLFFLFNLQRHDLRGLR